MEQDVMTITSRKDKSPRYFVDSQGEVTRLYMTDEESRAILTCDHIWVEFSPIDEVSTCKNCGLTEIQIKALEKRNNEHSSH